MIPILTPAAFPPTPTHSLEQAGHEIILQVEGDDRCASVLRTQFPRARLERNLTALETLPAETEVLVGTLPWPEEQDDDNKARAVVEQPWLPASRAAAAEEHAHFFRLLATKPVSWVVLELPVALLRWATAAVPGTRPFGFFFHRASPPRLPSVRTHLERSTTPACFGNPPAGDAFVCELSVDRAIALRKTRFPTS